MKQYKIILGILFILIFFISYKKTSFSNIDSEAENIDNENHNNYNDWNNDSNDNYNINHKYVKTKLERNDTKP